MKTVDGIEASDGAQCSALVEAAGARRRRPLWLYGVWSLESLAAFAAMWALTHSRSLDSFLITFAYLLGCAAALTVPGHALRALAARLGLSWPSTRAVLQALLVIAAGMIVAAVSTDRWWWTIAAILLTGNALWALELHERQPQRPA